MTQTVRSPSHPRSPARGPCRRARRVQDHRASSAQADGDPVRAEDGVDPPARGSAACCGSSAPAPPPAPVTGRGAACRAAAAATASRPRRAAQRSRAARAPSRGDRDRPRRAAGGGAATVAPPWPTRMPRCARRRRSALGLIGDPSASAALTRRRSADTAVLVRGRAAEALGSDRRQGGGRRDRQARRGVRAASGGRRRCRLTIRRWPAAPEAEAFKLAMFALVRLGAWDALSAAVLDGGRPISQLVAGRVRAAAHQRPARAAGAARARLGQRAATRRPSRCAASARLKDADRRPSRAPAARRQAAARSDRRRRCARRPTFEARRRRRADHAYRRRCERASQPAARSRDRARHAARRRRRYAVVQDLMTDPWPVMRIAALRAAAAIDPETFVIVLASLEPDAHWTVRAALADVLATLPRGGRGGAAARDAQRRRQARPAAGAAGAGAAKGAGPADAAARAGQGSRLRRARRRRRSCSGELKPAGGAAALREAYKAAGAGPRLRRARRRHSTALAAYGAAEATETLKAALADREWAVRVRAAELLDTLEPAVRHRQAMRPAPGTPPAAYTIRADWSAEDVPARLHRDRRRGTSSSSSRCSTRRRRAATS